MPVDRVRVQITPSGRGRVTVDGRELPGVRSVSVEHSAGSPHPRVTVEFIARTAPVEYVDALDHAEDEQEVSPDGTA